MRSRILIPLFVTVVVGVTARASKPPPTDAIWANAEYAFIYSSGEIDSQLVSPAFRIGTSSDIMFPLNSSIEFGFLDADRKRYSRINLASIGQHPQVTRADAVGLWVPHTYFRVDWISAVWAEGGHVAYSPGAEAGASFRFGENWALSLGARYAVDTTNMKGSMAGVVVGLTQLLPYDGR